MHPRPHNHKDEGKGGGMEGWKARDGWMGGWKDERKDGGRKSIYGAPAKYHTFYPMSSL